MVKTAIRFFAQNFTTKIVFMLLIIELGQRGVMVTGEVYKVGDSAGWTDNFNLDYGIWASSKTFHVNDVLLFEYNVSNNNVIQITHSDFQSCNTLAPIKTFNSGNDSFTIKTPGHYYFTSNFSGHCQAGQRLVVRVLKTAAVTIPSPLPSKGPVEVKAPAPSPAVESRDFSWLFMSTFGLIVSGFLVLVNSFA